MLTEAQLRAIMPHLPASKAALFLPHLNEAMSQYGIASMMRTAAFVAQLAHESGEFRWMEEIWGPTPAQRRYEPLTDLSRRLGNTDSGDGKRFKGRGPIQLTGRANYLRFGDLLGIDLMTAPEQAAAPEAAFRVAALYWKSRGLNELADAENFREITRRINGGFNGLADRQKYFERAKAVLATAFEAGLPPATRGLAAPAAREVPAEPLTRGFEAIRELAPRKRPAKKKAATRKAAAKEKPPAAKGVVKKPKTRRASKGTAKKPATAAARKRSGKKPAAAKKPVTNRASAKKSTARPAAKKPARKKPAAHKPRAKKKPATKKPATQKPRTKKAATKKRAAASRPRARRR
jgi:predicted chitinase